MSQRRVVIAVAAAAAAAAAAGGVIEATDAGGRYGWCRCESCFALGRR